MAYKVVFTNGEKRELVVPAARVQPECDGRMIGFQSDASQQVALVPAERVLYVIKCD